jgi:Putative ATP-dependent DNA helicase recG C-terminal
VLVRVWRGYELEHILLNYPFVAAKYGLIDTVEKQELSLQKLMLEAMKLAQSSYVAQHLGLSESPGRLPDHITEENILREQSARNPKLVRLINKFPDPPNKDVGEGLNTAFEAMRRLRLEEPEIEESDHSVTVYIRHTPLASAHDTVMAYLGTNPEITNRIARELTGIRSENSMKNVLLKLKERNMIEPVPGKEIGGGAAWRKVDRGKQ